ncbi:MAG: type IIL restriction-modification enzyme MmeI [Acidimicrobiales bacterium]
MYGAIKGADVVPVTVLHSPYGLPAMVSAQQVFSHGLAVFANSDWSHFGVLSSAVHTAWAVNRGSTLETRIRYTPTDVYETFPMPHYANANVKLQFGELARRLHNHRASLMTRSGLGLTKMYNKFHDPVENDPDIKSLRGLHIELDTALCDAYGWSDIDLDHHHWETPQGIRFTIGIAARQELLDRLLELNHQRYAEEVAAGLHDKKAKKSAKKRSPKKVSRDQEAML